MPERSVAQSVHAALVLLGWAGLITAGVSFPAMAILTHSYAAGGMTALHWLGPAGLFVGCLASVISIFFAHAAIGLPLPSSRCATRCFRAPRRCSPKSSIRPIRS